MAAHGPEQVGINEVDGGPLYLLQVGSFAGLPQNFVVQRPFALLIAGDASHWEEEPVKGFARGWIESGLAYACCWGDRSRWVHDMFDAADLALGKKPSDGVVMTTWHEGGEIGDAVFELAVLAFADEDRFTPIEARLAVTVGNGEFADQIRHELQRFAVR